MITETNQYTVIRAEEGYFLANRDMTLYGYEIILGKYDSPENYTEYPIDQWPELPPIDEPTVPTEPVEPVEPEEPAVPEEPSEPSQIALARASKLRDVDAYDNSTHVNGFLFNGSVMWLDRETRSSLRNTIESATLVGRTELDIWFGDVYITLPLNEAKMMLAMLEVYATDCYNVTAQHKVQLKAMTSMEDILGFDVTEGYPQMPEFNNR